MFVIGTEETMGAAEFATLTLPLEVHPKKSDKITEYVPGPTATKFPVGWKLVPPLPLY